MSDENKKKVDDAWKEQVGKEKTEATTQKEAYYEPTFAIFISSLSMQAMIAAGKLKNPVTGELEKNLDQARFLIDTLGVIKEKTKNNLTPEEDKLLEESLYSLRLVYVEEKKKP